MNFKEQATEKATEQATIQKVIERLNKIKTMNSGKFDREGNEIIIDAWFTLYDLADEVREELDKNITLKELRKMIETSNNKDLKNVFSIFIDKHSNNLYKHAIDNPGMKNFIEMTERDTFGTIKGETNDFQINISLGEDND